MLGPPFDILVTGKPWSGLMVVLEIVKLWPSPSFSGRGLFHYIADDDSEGHNSSYDDDGGGGGGNSGKKLYSLPTAVITSCSVQ